MSSPSWDQQFESLKRFHQQNGHTNVHESNPELSAWVDEQHQAIQTLKLPPDRFLKLHGLAVVSEHQTEKGLQQNIDDWDQAIITNGSERTWERQFKKLEAFKKKYEITNMEEETDDDELASWCRLQRNVYGCGEMEPKHFKRLVGIQFQFVDLEDLEDTAPSIGHVKCLDLCDADQAKINFSGRAAALKRKTASRDPTSLLEVDSDDDCKRPAKGPRITQKGTR